MTGAGTLFEWALATASTSAAGHFRKPSPERLVRRASAVDPRLSGTFQFEGRERACVLHLSVTPGPCSVDVRDPAGKQLQGFDGPTFAQVLRDVRAAGVSFDEDAGRSIGRAVTARRERA